MSAQADNHLNKHIQLFYTLACRVCHFRYQTHLRNLSIQYVQVYIGVPTQQYVGACRRGLKRPASQWQIKPVHTATYHTDSDGTTILDNMYTCICTRLQFKYKSYGFNSLKGLYTPIQCHANISPSIRGRKKRETWCHRILESKSNWYITSKAMHHVISFCVTTYMMQFMQCSTTY